MDEKEFDEMYGSRRLDTEAYSLSYFMDTGVNWREPNDKRDIKIIHRIGKMQATIKLLRDCFSKGMETFEELGKDSFFYKIARKNILEYRNEWNYNS